MERDGRLKRLVIVGGGTAGWIAALYLNRIVRRLSCEVTLVESAAIGTIGVGEATVPTFVHLLRMLGLDEAQFMRRCSATYKMGIQFEGWRGPGHSYFHPFGGSGRIAGLDLFHFWLRYSAGQAVESTYIDYALQARLARDNNGPSPTTLKTGAYAYHLDAGALATYLKELAVAEGVRHYFGTVGEVTLADNGDLASIDIGGGRTIGGDLFIDATGFSALLIEQTLGDRWIDWSNLLLNDRAVTMPLPVEPNKVPYTRSIAGRAGWMWRIPLNSRTGSGYVYSSAHLSDESAVEELVQSADLRTRRAADPRFLRIRVGRRTQFWKRNCVSIGLASGFIEPLESTAIHLIQRAVMLLADHLPDQRIDAPLRDAFNEKLGREYDEIRDFVLLHYIINGRSESFWRDAREVTLPDRLDEFLALYDVCGLVDPHRVSLFEEASYHYIMSGCGRLPARPMTHTDALNRAAVGDALRERSAYVATLLKDARPHDAMIAAIHERTL